ncbi:MAG: hypothetical protein VKQ33_09375 [Candidatus Sericytochromatia bacterium]|nr:hypothetical protein [Candidatus Sericytochromatia bacterium]
MLEWLVPLGGLWALQRLGVVELDFPVRSRLRWRRGTPRLPHEPKAGLFTPEGQAEADRLVGRYGLEAWAEASGRGAFECSLIYLQMLERAFEAGAVALPDRLEAVDIGPGDWFYVRAEHAFLTRWGTAEPRHVSLDGVELDAWRLYLDLRTRADWAGAYLGDLPDVRYLPADGITYNRPVDVALLFFPFLFMADHRAWGLPRKLLRPEALLAHLVGRLKPGGLLFIANQGSAERELQHRLLAASGLTVRWWDRYASPLAGFDPEWYTTVVVKDTPDREG